jgi:hypothetical protein
MDSFSKRFEQDGGNLYDLKLKENDTKQDGGGNKTKLSPRSENWKKKFLEIQLENKSLKAENKRLKKKIGKLESKDK